MIDTSHFRGSSFLTVIGKSAGQTRPTPIRIYLGGRRGFLVALTSVVAIQTWALFPASEQGAYVRLPDVPGAVAAAVKSATKGVIDGPLNALGLVGTDLVNLTQPALTRNVGASSSEAAAYPGLSGAVDIVPVKVKLQALLTLLASEADSAKRVDLQAILLAMLKLPEEVLLQVLQHPDLVDFNKMLTAVFLGDTDLWWIEFQLTKIAVVPVTTTTSRIDVGGAPAFVFDSAVAARPENGGSPTAGLRALPPSPSPQQAPASIQAPVQFSVPASVPDAVATPMVALAPATIDVQPSPPVVSADVMTVAPSPDPIPAPSVERSLTLAPDTTPIPSADPTPPEPTVTAAPIESGDTQSTAVFDNGNKFSPETKQPEPSVNNSSTTETGTAATPPDAGAEQHTSTVTGDSGTGSSGDTSSNSGNGSSGDSGGSSGGNAG